MIEKLRNHTMRSQREVATHGKSEITRSLFQYVAQVFLIKHELRDRIIKHGPPCWRGA